MLQSLIDQHRQEFQPTNGQNMLTLLEILELPIRDIETLKPLE